MVVVVLVIVALDPQTPAPVAAPGVRVMGRPLIGHLPFMLFMLMCSLMMPLIQGAPSGSSSTAALFVLFVVFPKAIRYTLNNFPHSDEIFMECLVSEE